MNDKAISQVKAPLVSVTFRTWRWNPSMVLVVSIHFQNFSGIFIQKMQAIKMGRPLLIVSTCFLMFFINSNAMAQQSTQIVRLARIQVDPGQLEQYNAALKLQMTTAIQVEPGVLTYYAVSDKHNPSHITILEIYADSAAYKSHIETPHFKKYKETVQNMVKSLELVDVNLISVAKKPGM